MTFKVVVVVHIGTRLSTHGSRLSMIIQCFYNMSLSSILFFSSSRMREQVRAGECLGSNKDNASSNHCSHGWRLKYPLGKRMWHTRNEDMCHCAEKRISAVVLLW